MKKIYALLILSLLLPGVSYAAVSLIEGEFMFYDASGAHVEFVDGGYSGEIDLASQTGTLQSASPFNGAFWSADITKVFVYDADVGGEQSFSWDVTKQVWFDPYSSAYILECYVEINGCDVVSPGAILLQEQIIPHPFMMNQPGQFAIATYVSWYTNVIPNLMTVQSQSGVLDPSSTTFVPFDGDLDGAPGYALLEPPFPGQTFAFSGVIGSKDGIFVSELLVSGGDTHECTSVDGANVSASANVTVNNDSIDSIEWTLDGAVVGAGPTVNLVAPLGGSELVVRATAVSGKTASKSTTIRVRDTTPPELTVKFIDTKSNEVVNAIDRNGLTRLIADYTATDTCDISPTVTATGGFNIANQSFLPLKVLNDEIIMDIPEIKISAVAIDSSSNSKSSSATLTVK